MEYITASCVIRDHVVYTNERAVFEERTTGSGQRATDLPTFLTSTYHHFHFQYPKFYKMDLISKLGWLAGELLLKEGFDPGNYRPEEIAIVLSNANASLDTDYKYFATVKDIPSPSIFVYTLPNIMIGEICIRHKFKGENAFFISEAFDADFIEQYVRGLMSDDNTRACICGWVDVLGEEYTAALFLIEKETVTTFSKAAVTTFSAENMDRIFHLQNARHE
jgi:hypothetical protein